MISISEIAVQKIKELSDDEGIGHYNIRVSIVGKGCSGFAYDMYYEDVINETDEITEQDGIKVIIDEVSFQYLNDMIIDYEDGLMSSGFKFINDQVKSTCACKQSVSF